MSYVIWETELNTVDEYCWQLRWRCRRRRKMTPMSFLLAEADTVDSRYLDFGYLEQPLISKKKSGPCYNTEI